MSIYKINFAIGISALCFQALVLYPCHEAISDQMERIEVNTKKLNDMEKQLEKHFLLRKQKKIQLQAQNTQAQ